MATSRACCRKVPKWKCAQKTSAANAIRRRYRSHCSAQTRFVAPLNVLSCRHFICNATRHKVQVNTTKTLAEVATATSPQSQSSQCMPLSVPDETFQVKFSTKANILLCLTQTLTHAHKHIRTYTHTSMRVKRKSQSLQQALGFMQSLPNCINYIRT